MNVLNTAKEAHDCADVLQDLNRINDAIANIQNYNGIELARGLDEELRIKYPCIDEMLNMAQAMPPCFPAQCQNNIGSLPEAEHLRQDYYGIICGTAIKKGVVHEMKDMIERVN